MRLIDADEEIRFANENLPDAHAGVITAFLRDCSTIDPIPTLEGNHLACVGDYIIRGVAGEYYPCKPDIFEKTYEPVEG